MTLNFNCFSKCLCKLTRNKIENHAKEHILKGLICLVLRIVIFLDFKIGFVTFVTLLIAFQIIYNAKTINMTQLIFLDIFTFYYFLIISSALFDSFSPLF